jgi:DNA repair protein RadC
MNLAMLDRSDLEAIVLDPSSAVPTHLTCSDNTITEYMPQPMTLRQARLRHVIAAAHELLTRVATDAVRGKSVISAATLKEFLRVYFAGAERESFVVVYVDTNLRVIEVEELFAGTLTHTSVYPREIVKRALHFNAAAVCLSHCHPSGIAEPSRADEHLTATVKAALALIDVRVLDHIVVASNGSAVTSMAERGLV